MYIESLRNESPLSYSKKGFRKCDDIFSMFDVVAMVFILATESIQISFLILCMHFHKIVIHVYSLSDYHRPQGKGKEVIRTM